LNHAAWKTDETAATLSRVRRVLVYVGCCRSRHLDLVIISRADTGHSGDGAVFSSIEDFVVWDQFWRGNELISADLLSEAFEKPKLNDGSLSDYDFGWVLTDKGAWHNGEWFGAATHISRGVRDRTCIVVLDNSSSLIVDAIVAELEREVAAE
jgi:hypothetical protein